MTRLQIARSRPDREFCPSTAVAILFAFVCLWTVASIKPGFFHTMADVSNVSLTGDVSVDIKKAKGRPRRARPGKDARTDGTAGTEAVTGDVSQNEAGDAAASGQAKDGKTRRKRKETGLTAEPKTAAPEAAAAATADISAAQENHVRRSRKGKARELKHLTAEEQGVSSKLPFLRLSEPLGKSARLPPVFSHDGR